MKREFIFLAIFLNSLLFGDMPEPYRSIVDLPFDDHGWFGNSSQLHSIITAKTPKTAIEIGSWLGCSARFIASQLPDDGILYAIDTWNGSTNEEQHLQDPRLPYLYQLFLSNVKHAQLTHKIIPVRMSSLEASRALNVKADLIYIDASHDTESVTQDIMAWHQHLNDEGILCGDDWGHEPVRIAVYNCANILKKNVGAYGNFWWYYSD